MHKHPKYIELKVKLHGVKAAIQDDDPVKASLMMEEAMLDFMKFIASDRDTRVCCQDWITDCAHEFTQIPHIDITRAP